MIYLPSRIAAPLHRNTQTRPPTLTENDAGDGVPSGGWTDIPRVAGGGNLFFQPVNARYEKGAMILTSNRGFAEWGEVFGDPVVATALLDRLLHHAVVIQIEDQATG